MNEIVCINNGFEGRLIGTILYRGQPAWIAREIGVACGYAQGGKRLVTLITTDWFDEFIEGIDYILVSGSDLAAFTDMLGEGTQHVPFENRRGLLILLEPGLYLALVKTRKPVGRRLRRFLAMQVLPQLARDGRYLPERSPHQRPLDMSAFPLISDASTADPAERRLLKAAELCTLLAEHDRKGALSPEVRTAYQVVAAELAMGTSLAALMPAVDEVWQSPSEIATRFGVSAQRIGLVVTALSLRGKEGLSRKIINKAKGHARTVESYLYCQAAVELIECELRRQGRLTQEATEGPASEGASSQQEASDDGRADS